MIFRVKFILFNGKIINHNLIERMLFMKRLNADTIAKIDKEVTYLGKDVTDMRIKVYDREGDASKYLNDLDEIIRRATELKSMIEKEARNTDQVTIWF